MLRSNKLIRFALLTALILNLPFIVAAQKDKTKEKTIREGTPVLWQEPTDISSRNLHLGPGGEEMKPDLSTVTFVEQKQGGYSTKYEVRDGSGRRWVAKLGKEAQPDTAANRLL